MAGLPPRKNSVATGIGGNQYQQLAPKTAVNSCGGCGHGRSHLNFWQAFCKLGWLNFFVAFFKSFTGNVPEETMKTTSFLSNQAVLDRAVGASELPSSGAIALAEPAPSGGMPREYLRHILLGSPEAVRQTIYLLHRLRYSETGLWSPVVAVEESLIITPAQGEAMSLLRKQV